MQTILSRSTTGVRILPSVTRRSLAQPVLAQRFQGSTLSTLDRKPVTIALPEAEPSRPTTTNLPSGSSPYLNEDTTASELDGELKSTLRSWQARWERVEDKPMAVLSAAAAVAAVYASFVVMDAVDHLPQPVPKFFGFIGLIYSARFTYRYLLFKAGRDELREMWDRRADILTSAAHDAEDTAQSAADKIDEAVDSPSRSSPTWRPSERATSSPGSSSSGQGQSRGAPYSGQQQGGKGEIKESAPTRRADAEAEREADERSAASNRETDV